MFTRLLQRMTRSPLSLFGVLLTSVSALLIITLFALKIFGFGGGPYLGILAFVILPALFVFGLLLIPIGLHLQARRRRKREAAGEEEPGLPIIDLNRPRTRQVLVVVALLTVVNLVILTVATFEAVEVMESNEFCGTTCHTVMEPEWVAYQDSAHSRVDCVECHIGEGADWFVKSKLSGSYQLYSVAFDKFPRPVTSPVHSLRPARDTCEQCHWPTKFVGNKLVIKTIYGNDEESSEMMTALLLKVGGLRGDSSHGIHWHVDPGVEIRYLSDRSRETIYDVEMTRPDGSVHRYGVEDAPEGDEELEWRTMDCIDCHNRPSHRFDGPAKAVDKAILHGDLDRGLPYVRKYGVAAVQGDYGSDEEARQGIERSLREAWGDSLSPEQEAQVPATVDALFEVWARNVFPEMNLDWGTHAHHIGHEESPGCYRCHDDEHETEDGDVISSDCDVCHTIVAMEEDPADVAEALGMDL